jgi:ABC-2 type transport system ATP-binding protein
MYFLIRRLIRIWRSRRPATQAQAQIQNEAPGPAPTTEEPATDEAATDESQVRPARPAARRVTSPPPETTGKVNGSAALSVSGLTKRFGDRVAFSDVSFEVGYGEVFGFLGPNGAGKTTTVRTLGTLFAPTSGSASVAGIPLSPENGAEIRRRISIMPESPGLYLRLSDPVVLFLDEPTAGLDPVAARDVHELIDDLRQHGVTIFLTTHRLEEAERLCDRVAILNRTLRTVGRPEELRERMFAKSLTVRTLAPLPEPGRVFGGLPAVDGWQQDGAQGYAIAVSDTRIAAPAVTRALVEAGADVLSLGESRHSLEDVYLELIDEDEEAKSR